MLYTILFVPKYYIISSERMRVNPKGQYTIHILFYFVQLFYIYVFAAIHTASEMYSHVFLYKLQPPCCRLSAMHFILCFVVKAIHMYYIHRSNVLVFKGISILSCGKLGFISVRFLLTQK